MDTPLSPLAEACKHVGGQAELARRLGVSPSMVNQWLAGHRPIPDGQCVAIERITDGSVTVDRLNDGTPWVRVEDPHWPHVSGRPCIDAANSEQIKRAALAGGERAVA